jgi:aspartate/methionine/tyrosine aminotransferase
MAQFSECEIMSLADGGPRYDLGASLSPNLRLAELVDAVAYTSLGDLRLGYTAAAGDQRLRRAIADAHGVSADAVVVTVGGMHALFLVVFILCDRGDEVVTTSPSFPPAGNALDVVGASVRTLPLCFHRRYQPDLNELRGRLSGRTKIVSLASPQNPSGVAIPPQTLREILGLMQENCPQAYLLIDETYREAAFGDAPVAASAVTLGSKVVSVASLSKCHGAPGLRVGWAVTQAPALRQQLVLGKFHTVISCSAIDEALGLKVLEQRDRISADRRRHLAEGLGTTAGWVLENAAYVDWVRPDAGAICCVRLKPAVFDDVAVSCFYGVLADADVRVANGSWFGDEARVFRLGFGYLSVRDLHAALSVLTTALRHAARAAA